MGGISFVGLIGGRLHSAVQSSKFASDQSGFDGRVLSNYFFLLNELQKYVPKSSHSLTRKKNIMQRRQSLNSSVCLLKAVRLGEQLRIRKLS